jgi:hypothetical protein
VWVGCLVAILTGETIIFFRNAGWCTTDFYLSIEGCFFVGVLLFFLDFDLDALFFTIFVAEVTFLIDLLREYRASSLVKSLLVVVTPSKTGL